MQIILKNDSFKDKNPQLAYGGDQAKPGQSDLQSHLEK